MIAVIGAAGTIGRNVAGFLDDWGAEVARRDFRLEGREQVDARDPGSLARALEGAAVVVNCADYRGQMYVGGDGLAWDFGPMAEITSAHDKWSLR